MQLVDWTALTGKTQSLFVIHLSKVTMANNKYHLCHMVVCALEFL